MRKVNQVAVQEQKPRFTPLKKQETRSSRIEPIFRKVVLAAVALLGIGYILVNAPIAILIGSAIPAIPIASQANINAITARILYVMASAISITLGGLLIFGAVRYYELGQTKGIVFLGVLLGSFYLLCLGVGSTLLLSQTNLAALMLTVAPIAVMASATMYTSPNPRCRLLGSAIGILAGVTLAYAIFNLKILDLVLAWGIPFTGPFMSLTVLESAVVIFGPIAAAVHSLFGYRMEERPLSHMFTLALALVYGLGAFIGSLVVSMSFWNFIWKSPWVGPFFGLSESTMNMVVFWSASLVLMDIAGISLIVAACLGFIRVAQGL